MSDDAPKSLSLPQIPWTSLAPIITLLTGLILAGWSPLDSPRPPTTGEVENKVASKQNISARLWQDPISVALKTVGDVKVEASGTNPPPMRTVCSELRVPPGLKSCDKILLMPVLMLQGSYGQDVEFRSRTRFAVMTGLWSGGYAPDDSDHIGAFRIPIDEPADEEGIKKSSVATIGFEWCSLVRSPGTNLNKHVLVLWINETDVGVEPLDWLRQFVEKCQTALSGQTVEKARVLLAGSSTTLKRLAEKAAGNKVELAKAKQACKGLKADIFACTTTADDVALLPSGSALKHITQISDECRLGRGIILQRTLATDGQMMDSIVAELLARRVLPRRPKSGSVDKKNGPPVGDNIPPNARVVLISEYDTDYGRNLPLAFARAAIGHEAQKFRSVQDLVAEKQFSWLDIHNYARGFDGRLQGDAGAKAASADKDSGKSKDSAPASAPPGEANEGLNQSDYLRRLALEIEVEDRKLRAADPDGGGVRAVGILGSDVYDKLMVLKALRTRLPETIFFTTDLDARLAQPKDWKVTHNLVIASPYSLSPDADHARAGRPGSAPFRDSYQTSVFKSVCQVLGGTAESCASNPVRMFEVGRGGAVELNTKDNIVADTSLSHLAGRAWRGLIWITLLVCIAMICGIIFVERSADPRRPGWSAFLKIVWRNSWLWFLFSCLTSWLLTLWLASRAMKYGDAEPLAFSDGVSIWPTVGFRILGVLLGIHFLAKARRSLAMNGRKLTEKFFSTHFVPVCPQGTLRERFGEWLSRNRRIIFSPEDEAPGRDAAADKRVICPHALWIHYWRLTNKKSRRARIGLMAVLYLLGGLCLFSWFGKPVPPVRGDFAANVESISLIFWVVIQTVLTFAVLDSLLQMTALIRRMNKGRSAWPRDTLRKERDPALEHLSLCEVLDIRLIGARTEKVGDLFLFPFLIQATGIMGRMPAIDNWSWPLALVIVIGLNIFFVIVSMVILRIEAENARKQSLVRLRSRLARQRRPGKDEKDEEKRRKSIESAIASVRDTTEGAFAPATQQPAIRWVLWLVSGIGAGGILQYLKDLI